MNEISDDADFCFDLIVDGCPIHANKGKIFICKPNGDRWLNTLVVNIVEFPKREIIGDEVASGFTKIWIEKEDWLDLNLEPNFGQDAAYDILYETIMIGRRLSVEEMDRLVETCSRKKFSEAMRELGF